MWASQNGHVEVVDKLLHHGARPDLQDEVYPIIHLFSKHTFHDLALTTLGCGLIVFPFCVHTMRSA